VLLVFATAAAATWTVEPDGRGDFETLAEAATVVVTGDTVIVGDGTWAGATFSSRVTVRGKNGSGSTTIDGAGVAALTGWAGLDVEGLTLTSAGTNALVIVGGGTLKDSAVRGSGTEWSTYGGGASFWNGDYLVEGCSFEDNHAYIGGAVYLTGTTSTLTVSGSRFTGNTSAYGGGIGVDSSGALELSDNDFDGNSAYYHGGGVYAAGENAVVASTNRYTGNTAPNGWGGAVFVGAYASFDANGEVYSGNSGNFGGALASYYGSVQTASARYEDNTAGASGGAVQLYASSGGDTGSSYTGNGTVAGSGGAMNVEFTPFDLASPTFTGNTAAAYGGALSVFTAAVATLTGATFSENEAVLDGGALAVMSASATTTDTVYDGNIATYGGASTVQSSAALYESYPTYSYNYAQGGGALYANNYATVDQTGATYTDNTAYGSGGAVYTYYGSVLLEEAATFADNTATYGYGAHAFNYYYGTAVYRSTSFRTGLSYYDGGAIYAYYLYDGGLTLEDTVLDGNTATYGSGGAVHTSYSPSLTLDRVEVTNNSAYNYGGGLAIFGGVSTVITDSRIELNQAALYAGGGIHWDAYTTQAFDFTLADSSVSYNAAEESGGGLYVGFADLVDIQGSTFTGNVAGPQAYGGGLFLGKPNGGVGVGNSRFVSNTAGFGGGAYVEGTTDLDVDDHWHNNIFTTNTAAVGGAACFVRGVHSSLSNITFVGNAASEAGGSLCLSESGLLLENTVIAYTAAGAALHLFEAPSDARPFETPYLNLYGNAAGDVGGELTETPANLGADPGFVGWTNDGRDNDSFVLTATSAMRDAGDPALSDPDGSRSDIGAWGGPDLEREDADGDGHWTDSDCDDGDATIHPGATDAWYDGLDSDCAGNNDDDQDGDGTPLDADCDDTDPAVGAPCGDTASVGAKDTAPADEGDTPPEGCGCTTGVNPAALLPALGALALVRRRRRLSR
jgi:uncharacterized protein (TIGR03382 family)